MRVLLTLLMMGWLMPVLAADLSGKWFGDDGATYYMRQIGDDLYWYSESNTRSSIFTGKVRPDDLVLGSWVDLPKGTTTGKGELHLALRANGNVLEPVRMTGGFPATKISRAGYKPPPPPLKETCLDFDPAKLSVQQPQENDFRIMQDTWWLFDFGDKEAQAYTAMKIIQQYGMNQSCFIGKPEPVFRFLLVGGRAPLGQWYGEDCVPFHPSNTEVVQRDGRWQIMDGELKLYDFDPAMEKEARAALAVIKKYEFTNACYVGRPSPTFEYLRR